MFRRIVRLKQHDLSDCGAACLFSVAAYHGLRVSLGRIRDYASTTCLGTNILGLVQAANRLGLSAKGVKGRYSALRTIPKPAIAHLNLRGELYHFVVLYGYARRHVVVMDPADGRVHRIAHRDFASRWTGVLILMAPSSSFRPERGPPGTIRRFWALVRPHRTLLVQSFAGAALYTLLSLSTAIYVQKIVDNALPDGNRNLLNLLGSIMLAVLAAQLLIGWIRHRITLITGQRIDAALILGYYEHLLHLPQRFFDTRRVGEITSRIGDAVKIRTFINDVALDLTISALVVVLSMALMLAYSPPLAALVFAAVPLYALIYGAANRANRHTQRQVMERGADLEAELVESLSSVSTIRAYGLAAWAAHRLELRLVGLLRPVYRSGMNAIAATTSAELVSRSVTIGLLWLGGGLVIAGRLTTGELMSFFALAGYLTGPVGSLIMANRSLQDAVIAADRLFEVMDLDREERTRKPRLTPGMGGEVRFQNVHFGYGAGRQVLDGLDLVLPQGRMTAIVGESGSGKSTIVSLAQGLYPVQRGRVSIGGVDIRDLSLESLRRHIAAVPQDVRLISGTVMENIALGEFEPDIERVTRVCEEAGATEFIQDLPAGFRTVLGENGVALSGGQRQRLALARALYRDPFVLLLDEATSSLDSRAEERVQNCLLGLRSRGKTLILIAHRLSTVREADKIVVLEGGRTVEEGTHQELLTRGGLYQELWRRQHPAPLAGAFRPGPDGHGFSRPEAVAPAGRSGGMAGPAWLRSIVF